MHLDRSRMLDTFGLKVAQYGFGNLHILQVWSINSRKVGLKQVGHIPQNGEWAVEYSLLLR